MASPRRSCALLALFVFLAALGGASPAPAQDYAPRRKLLIIGIDGLRSDAFMAARAPRLKRLMREGAYALDAWADTITRSGPGWASIVTGVWHGKHGVVSNGAMGAQYRGAAYPHFFRHLKDHLTGVFVASIVNWRPINDVLLQAADLALAPGNDDSVAAQAARLIDSGDPDVLFLHFDAPDHAGHGFGFSRFSPAYLYAVRRTDDRVGRVLDALAARKRRCNEEWLILCTTDHGGSLRHHGEDIPQCRRVLFVMAGDGVVPGSSLEGAGLADVAPTALAWMGVPIDPAWNLDGKPLGLREPPAPLASR